MRSGADRHADFESRVSADLHVLFPRVVAGKAGLAVAGVAGCGGPALRSTADCEALQQLAIETDVELLRPSHALDVVLVLPLQTNLDQVLAFDRKVVVNRKAAARSERQILALALVLHDVKGNLERLDARARRRKTYGEPRHLTSDRQIAFEMGRRDRERIREVVEAAIRGFVARQQRLHVEAQRIEREQVAHGVAVFGAIEAVDCADSPWIRIRDPRAIDFRLEPARDGVIRGAVGTRPPRRRHRAGAELRDDALPHFCVCSRSRDVDRVEHQPGGAKLLVVAGDAVLIEDGLR